MGVEPAQAEEKAATTDAAAPAAPKEVWEGVCAGKYAWSSSTKAARRPADAELAGEAITQYSWADGKRSVSVYVQLPALDAVPETELSCTGEGVSAMLSIGAIGEPPKKRTLALRGLANQISGARIVRKLGKDMVVLRLQKREECEWLQLLRGSNNSGGGGGGGGEDDDEEPVGDEPLDGEDDAECGESEEGEGSEEEGNEETNKAAASAAGDAVLGELAASIAAVDETASSEPNDATAVEVVASSTEDAEEAGKRSQPGRSEEGEAGTCAEPAAKKAKID